MSFRMSHNYTLDENTYPQFLRDNNEEMDLLSFIRTADPTKVRIGERKYGEGEPKILETTVGRVVSLLSVEQGHSASGEQGVGIQPVSEGEGIVAEDAAPLQPRRQKKRKTTAVDAGEPSHLVKRLRDEQGTPCGTFVGGKSTSAVHRLLVGAVRYAEVCGEAIPTLPFVSATPERGGEGHTESVTGPNLRAISAPQRFVISSDSSHHSSANITEAEVDSFVKLSVPVITAATITTSTVDPIVVVKEKIVKPSLFSANSASAGGPDPAKGGFTDLTSSDLLVSGIRTVISPDTDLQKVDEEIGNLKARLLLKEAMAVEAIRLRAEDSKFETIEKSLQGEVEALKEYAVITSVRSQNDHLTSQLEKFQDDQMKIVNEKLDKLYVDFVELALHLEEKFYPHLLTTISGCRWLLTHGMDLAVVKCLNSHEYLSVLGTAIGKAIEKGIKKV
nr:hypothetical protein [Tanacetum cinerariifolium]